MGSSGSGKFGNYHIDKNFNESKQNNGTNTSGIGGAVEGHGEVMCPNSIELIKLEDVPFSEYYKMYNNVPAKDEKVKLRNTLHNGRLVVELLSTSEIIGNLPTEYNYLFNCVRKGKAYFGEINSSGISPIPYVVVSLHG